MTPKDKEKDKDKFETRKLPMMPIRDVVIFPHMMTPFVVGRESSVRALEEALTGDKKIFLATQHDASVDEPKPSEIKSSVRLRDNKAWVAIVLRHDVRASVKRPKKTHAHKSICPGHLGSSHGFAPWGRETSIRRHRTH